MGTLQELSMKSITAISKSNQRIYIRQIRKTKGSKKKINF